MEAADLFYALLRVRVMLDHLGDSLKEMLKKNSRGIVPKNPLKMVRKYLMVKKVVQDQTCIRLGIV